MSDDPRRRPALRVPLDDLDRPLQRPEYEHALDTEGALCTAHAPRKKRSAWGSSQKYLEVATTAEVDLQGACRVALDLVRPDR